MYVEAVMGRVITIRGPRRHQSDKRQDRAGRTEAEPVEKYTSGLGVTVKVVIKYGKISSLRKK